MVIECSLCGALHWIDERTESTKKNPIFSRCCRKGKVILPTLLEPPQELMDLLEGDDAESKFYRDHIREYNASNAYTSLGCKLDKRVLKGKGPKGFAIHGELRHNTGTLLPDEGKDPIYQQLYFYDPNQALAVRAKRNPQLDKGVLEMVLRSLTSEI